MTIKTKLDQLKYEASKYKRERMVTHGAALEKKARDYGFRNYYEAQKALKDVPRDQT